MCHLRCVCENWKGYVGKHNHVVVFAYILPFLTSGVILRRVQNQQKTVNLLGSSASIDILRRSLLRTVGY